MTDRDTNAVAAALVSQIKKEKSITPPNHRSTASATPSPSQTNFDLADTPLNLTKPKQSLLNHMNRLVSTKYSLGSHIFLFVLSQFGMHHVRQKPFNRPITPYLMSIEC